MKKLLVASFVALTLAGCKTASTKDHLIEHGISKIGSAITAPYHHFSEGSLRSKVLKYNPKAKDFSEEEFRKYMDQFSGMSSDDFAYAEETFTKTGTADFDGDGKPDKYTITSMPVMPDWDGKNIDKNAFFAKKNVVTIEYATEKKFNYEKTGDRISDIKPYDYTITTSRPGELPIVSKTYTTTDLWVTVCQRSMGKESCQDIFVSTK